MDQGHPRTVVALDGGTTNTRARLLRDGRIVATARRAVGVRDTVLSASSRPVVAAVREAIEEVLRLGGAGRPEAVIASGMLTSEAGLAAIPHVEAPAGADDLAAAAREVVVPGAWDGPILLIPGVRTPPAAGEDGWTSADVMRGEECETLGVVESGRVAGPSALLWPGSHAKLVEVDALGRIAGSTTSLAGEITAAVARHTLIAGSLPDALPDAPDPSAAALGLRVGAEQGLGRAAFLVRLAGLSGALSPERRGAFWLGAVIGDDAGHLARHPILAGGLPLLVGGREPLRSLYVRAIRGRVGGAVEALDDEAAEAAAAHGALAVASRRWRDG